MGFAGLAGLEKEELSKDRWNIFKIDAWIYVGGKRGGTREYCSQKIFELTESFLGFFTFLLSIWEETCDIGNITIKARMFLS